MKIAFFYIWNCYQLVGSVGKSMATFYLSEVPDYAVFRWLSLPSLAWLQQLGQAERITARVGAWRQVEA